MWAAIRTETVTNITGHQEQRVMPRCRSGGRGARRFDHRGHHQRMNADIHRARDRTNEKLFPHATF